MSHTPVTILYLVDNAVPERKIQSTPSSPLSSTLSLHAGGARPPTPGPPGLPTPSPTLYDSQLGDNYVPTRAPTPNQDGTFLGDSHLPGDPYDPAERLEPHPYLRYATHLTTTHSETPALCDSEGEPLQAPPAPQPAVYLHPDQDDSPIPRRQAETPPPAGFYHNRGVHYIPFQIRDAHKKLWPTKFTQLILTSDPFVLAYREGSPQQYGKPVHATPQFERGNSPVYND